jgi:hypothetical protein
MSEVFGKATYVEQNKAIIPENKNKMAGFPSPERLGMI